MFWNVLNVFWSKIKEQPFYDKKTLTARQKNVSKHVFCERDNVVWTIDAIECMQWAKIVVSLERAVSQKDAHNYLQEYSIKLGPGDDPNNPASEQRGVMVIKSKSKTRARQRKGAVANWKVHVSCLM